MPDDSPSPGANTAAAVRDGDFDVDVIAIGGGVNGSGVARDCALRGLRVALFERNDFAFGASGNSSGMIHGGVRYLTYDPDVTRDSCLDSGYIQRVAPHLLFRIPFLMPIHRARAGARIALELFDAFFDLYDRYQPLKRGKPHVRLSADEIRRLEPGLSGENVGGVSFDEWGIDGARLCIANARDAHEHGARIYNHATVCELLRGQAGRVVGVRYRSTEDGSEGVVRAPIVVNAAGAWTPLVAAMGELPERAVRLRPGKGIHVVFDRRLSNFALVARAADGRQIFLEPWQNVSILGTTDDDYYGDLDRVVATGDEVRYLIQAMARVFPSILQARPIGTFAGVRPTLYAWGKNESDLSREHEIVDHTEHGAPGLFSMVGGKLASYRLFAEEATDVVERALGRKTACSTHRRPLPGGEALVDPLAVAVDAGVSATVGTRLEYRHGGRCLEVLRRLRDAPQEAQVVCACEAVIEAEVRYVVEREFARTVDDVSRRTRLGQGSCGGLRCAERCGALVAGCTDRSPEEGRRLALRFLVRGQRARRSVLWGAQARQEALHLSHLRAQLGAGAGTEELDA